MKKYDKHKFQQLIAKNAMLFWWVPDDKKSDLSEDAVVEAILNYGTDDCIKQLFAILGLDTVSLIFKRNTLFNHRSNYFPPVANFFHLYFKKYVPEYSKS